MVMTTKKADFPEAKKPVEMKRNSVVAGQRCKAGDIVEVNEKDFFFLTTQGMAIPHLGEPVAKKERKTRKKKDAGD